MRSRWLALGAWCFGVWVLLTWTRTAEQLTVGAAVAAVVAAACAPLGDVVRPWRLLEPQPLLRLLSATGLVLVGMVRANLSLTRRIWSPSRPIRPGMAIVPTRMRTAGGLTAVGLLTSLIVDNQLVDVDVEAGELQYHMVWIESPDPGDNRRRTNGPLESVLLGGQL